MNEPARGHFRVRVDGTGHGKNTKVSIDEKDVTACLTSLSLDVTLDDVPRVKMEGIAFERDLEVDANVEYVERVYRSEKSDGRSLLNLISETAVEK